MGVYGKILKPIIDVGIAALVFMAFSPLIVFITIMLFFANRGQPFFFQKRPGKNGKIFTIIKFKTMTDRRNEDGDLKSDYERLTWCGKVVRKTSLDELPQLLNILKGDMSLVGPRPLLPEYLPLYSPLQNRRHEVKPGITGWAQVNGRNALSWNEKFAYDVEYVDRLSFGLDVKIMATTIEKVVKRHGVNANNYMTMEAFKGNVI